MDYVKGFLCPRAPGWAHTMGTTGGLEGGRERENEVRLASVWAGCPCLKVTEPTRQLSLPPGSGTALSQAPSCPEMVPPLFPGRGNPPPHPRASLHLSKSLLY